MADSVRSIITLNFDEPIKPGSGTTVTERWSPWKLAGVFKVDNATLTRTRIIDDDDLFQTAYGQSGRHDVQTLASATTLGNTEYAAGTEVQFYLGSRVEKIVDGKHSGDFFMMLYPAGYRDGGANEPMLGDGSSIFVIPVGKQAKDGTVTYPEFDQNASYYYISTPAIQRTSAIAYSPQCFTTGTLIDCDSGPRRIETIQPGDLVRTRDNGLRRVRWIGARALDAAALDLNPAFRPIRIHAGALGNGLPHRDLTVSPQHRVLVQSPLTQRLCGEAQVLVAAKHLTDIEGIEVVRTATEVTYWHMLLDGHELVRSNGAWTETLYTGPEAMKSLAPSARREILMLFPELANGEPISTPARPFLKGRDGRKIARHHVRSNAHLVEI